MEDRSDQQNIQRKQFNPFRVCKRYYVYCPFIILTLFLGGSFTMDECTVVNYIRVKIYFHQEVLKFIKYQSEEATNYNYHSLKYTINYIFEPRVIKSQLGLPTNNKKLFS